MRRMKPKIGVRWIIGTLAHFHFYPEKSFPSRSWGAKLQAHSAETPALFPGYELAGAGFQPTGGFFGWGFVGLVAEAARAGPALVFGGGSEGFVWASSKGGMGLCDLALSSASTMSFGRSIRPCTRMARWAW
jgi:hypothetical protein